MASRFKGGPKAAQQRYRKKHRAKVAAYQREYAPRNRDVYRRAYRRRKQRMAADPKVWLFHKFAEMKSSARRRRVAFRIAKAQWMSTETPSVCPVLGLLLHYGAGVRQPHSASIDRADNTRGYEQGNIRVISDRANSLRSNGTAAELAAVAEDAALQEFLRS